MTDDNRRADKGLANRLRRLASETLTKAATAMLDRAIALARGVEDLRRLPPPPRPLTPDRPPLPPQAAARAASSTVASSPAPVVPPPAAPAPPQEPLGMLDLVEPPTTYGTDEVHVVAQDPSFLFFYWEVTPAGWDRARAHLGGGGALTLRVWSTADDGHTEERDVPLDWDHGRRYLAAPRPGDHVSAAVGLRGDGGRFAAICHAPRIRVPWAEPATDAPVRWMLVEPDTSRGTERRRPTILAEGSPDEIAGALPAGMRTPRWREGLWEQLHGALGSSRTRSPS